MNGARVRPLGGGMNSETWMVEHRGSFFVAKLVASMELAELEAGCGVASMLAEAGLATGRPIPTLAGRTVLTQPALALLEHVPGRSLHGETDEEQEWMADTLAGVHAAGRPAIGPSVATFGLDWLSPELPGVASHRWLLAAIQAVREETDQLGVTWSVLHTDPSPGAFIHDDKNGVTGLIDWTGARRGPVLYDLASVVMYLGGAGHAATFLQSYESRGLVAAREMRHLDAFRRFRETVQGAYFAGRLATNNLTGDIDQAENEKGLADARRRLGALGLDTA
ncbi:MAG TPA: phosphotransferase [Nocardioides sp.]|nr:phosphotransferase [Nocardioides sp.]